MKTIPPFKSAHDRHTEERSKIFYEDELNSLLRVKNEISRTNSPIRSRSNSPIVSRTNSPLVIRTNSPLVSRTNSPLVSRTNSPLVSRTNSPLPELPTSRNDTKTRVFPNRYMYYDRKYYQTTLKTDYPPR